MRPGPADPHATGPDHRTERAEAGRQEAVHRVLEHGEALLHPVEDVQDREQHAVHDDEVGRIRGELRQRVVGESRDR